VHLELLSIQDSDHVRLKVEHEPLGRDFALGRRVTYDGKSFVLPKSNLSAPDASICMFMPIGERYFRLCNIWFYHANPHAEDATVMVDIVSVGARV